MVEVYVGKAYVFERDQLVLKYLVGLERKDICRYYPIESKNSIIYEGRWLNYSGLENVVFKDLNDRENGIYSLNSEELEQLKKGYDEGFVGNDSRKII